VANSLDLVLSDPNVKGVLFNIFGGITRGDEVAKGILEGISRLNVTGIFFNIFGGITRGDEVARGIVEGIRTLNMKVPLVVRLTGTNEAEGIAILQQNGITALNRMEDAARKIVELVAS
jgi:succinyl-CoA synthetase beta subunit